MTKRNLVLQAAVAAAVAGMGTAAYAAFTPPNLNTLYAVEAITPTTVVTLPPIVWQTTMGSRAPGEKITAIYTITGGGVFGPGPVALPVGAGGTGPCAFQPSPGTSQTSGGAGASFVIFDITVASTCSIGSTITLGPVTVANSGLNVFNGQVGITLAMADGNAAPGAGACFDFNPGSPNSITNAATQCLTGPSLRGSGAYAAKFNGTMLGGTDTSTMTDANNVLIIGANNAVPLGGFVIQPGPFPGALDDDVQSQARALVQVDNTSSGVMGPNGSTQYTLLSGDIFSLTVTDTKAFLGNAPSTGRLCWDYTNNTGTCDSAELFTLTIGSNPAVLTGIPGTFPTANTEVPILYNAAGSDMDTNRTLFVNGFVNVSGTGGSGGTSHALTQAPTSNTLPAHLLGGGSGWWVWNANGYYIRFPWFTLNASFPSKFIFMNTNQSPVRTTARVQSETGNNCLAAGPNVQDMIPAATGGNGTLIRPPSDYCTGFPTTNRGSISFLVHAPDPNNQQMGLGLNGYPQNGPGPAGNQAQVLGGCEPVNLITGATTTTSPISCRQISAPGGVQIDYQVMDPNMGATIIHGIRDGTN